jgi:hypothetical protein
MHAYRWLLYRAMLDIRQLQWIGGDWRQRLNPLNWGRFWKQVRMSGGIAEWLHNLAVFSAINFTRFDEHRFWQDYQWLLSKFPRAGLECYRTEFERHAYANEKQCSFAPGPSA